MRLILAILANLVDTDCFHVFVFCAMNRKLVWDTLAFSGASFLAGGLVLC